MRKLRILLADDHETVREGLKAILNAQADMEVVGEAVDGRAAVARATALRPDVVLMDVSMPELNGLEATEALKLACPTAKVVTLTRHAEGGYLQRLLRAGAEGYVLKQSRASELLHAIRAVAKGGKYVDPVVTERLIGDIHHRKPSDAVAHTKPQLSPREEEILRLVAWGHSNKEMAVQLGLSVKTVETHKANGMHKLGLTSRIDLIRFALLQGWLRDT